MNKSNLSKIFIGNSFGIAITTGTNIILIPLLLKQWGIELYGEWLVLFSVVMYANLLETGFHIYAINKTSRHFHMGKVNNIGKVLINTIYIYLVVFLLFFILYTILYASYDFFQLKLINKTQFQSIEYLLLAEICLMMLFNFMTDFYRSVDEYAKSVLLKNIFLLFKLLTITIVLISYHITPYQLAIIYFMIRFISILILIYFAIKKIKQHRITIKLNLLDYKYIKIIFFKGIEHFTLKIAFLFNFQGVILIVQHMFGPSGVATFSITRTLINFVYQLRTAYINSHINEFIKSSKNTKEIEIIINNIMFNSIFIVFSSSLIILYFSQEIFKLWNIDGIINRSLIYSYVIYVFMQTPWIVLSLFPTLINIPIKVSHPLILSNISAFSLMLIFKQFLILDYIPYVLTLTEITITYSLLRWYKTISISAINKNIALMMIGCTSVLFLSKTLLDYPAYIRLLFISINLSILFFVFRKTKNVYSFKKNC